MRAIRRFTVRPVLPEGLAALGDLAMNLRWCWHPETQDLFSSIDPELWQQTGRDPGRLLGALAPERLAELAEDPEFNQRLRITAADLVDYLGGERWYQRAQPGGPESPKAIGYFSPEFGITSVLPQYSGGLGILAGDHLKAASDLGVPIVGVGLLYRHGYFRQSLSREGWQQETYPIVDPDELPLSLLREPDGAPVSIQIDVPGDAVLHARVWVAQVGRVPLLLLDSDVEANAGLLRDVTDRLYGGTSEHRLLQEILLGIGGVRALRAYSRVTGAPAPEVFHTNEGHAGFLGLERIRELTTSPAAGQQALDFETALVVSRAGTVFTTHTPVPAGIDRFPRDLIGQYFGGHSPVPGVPVERILALGAEDYDGGDPGVFNMAVMGFRLAQRANGVSELHGEVSRGMFHGLWPAFDEAEVPITSITNGVHAPTWVAREVFELAGSVGGDTASGAPTTFEVADKVPGDRIWATKRALRQRLIDDARRRLAESWGQRGASAAELGWIDQALDPDVLTIGFARRVPSYKRLTLMLRDPARLKRLLTDPERPIQLIIAGKSHPADDGGKKLIQDIVRFADDPQVRHRIVFLPNYDIAMAQPLYPGCDVWLNNPLRPYEACGTSGMKAALNGGLNLSILDGWWDEWYDGNNGWAIPSADSHDDPDRRDDVEAHALYDLIENEVAPRFYDLDADGVPTRWIEMLRHTLKSLGPKVLASRMVKDYVEKLYVPAAQSGHAVNSDFAGAHQLADWKRRVAGDWSAVTVEHVEATGLGDSPEIGTQISVRAFVALGALSPQDVTVELVHGPIGPDDELLDTATSPIAREPMTLVETYDGGRYRFEGNLTLGRTGPFGYTVRVLPHHRLLATAAETGLVAVAG